MANHRLGLHWLRVHPETIDIRHIERMQYRSAKLFEWHWSNVNACRELLAVMPQDALFIARDHPLSEQKSEMERAAAETGRRHADEWAQKVRENRVHLPLDRTYFSGINEPNSNHLQRQINDYHVAFCNRLREHGLRAAAASFGVGHPSTVNLNPSGLPDWSHYEDMHAVIVEGSHCIEVHEYGLPDDHGWGFWCNRLQHCPWRDVMIIVGECGIDSGVGGDFPNKGWRHYGMTPEQYATWLDVYMSQLDSRVHSVQPFTYDFSHPWQSFDVRPARQVFETYQWKSPQPIPVPQPPTPAPAPLPPGPVPAPVPPRDDLFERSLQFVLRWEGGYVNNPNDPGGETNFGISKRSYPHLDIANLTRAQAVEIYKRDYWRASGADKMDWPLCLAHFDTAVNAGVGRAREMLRKSGDNFLTYMAHLIDWYTRIDNFEHFGRAWIRRRADILLEASR